MGLWVLRHNPLDNCACAFPRPFVSHEFAARKTHHSGHFQPRLLPVSYSEKLLRLKLYMEYYRVSERHARSLDYASCCCGPSSAINRTRVSGFLH